MTHARRICLFEIVRLSRKVDILQQSCHSIFETSFPVSDSIGSKRHQSSGSWATPSDTSLYDNDVVAVVVGGAVVVTVVAASAAVASAPWKLIYICFKLRYVIYFVFIVSMD